MRMIPEVGDTVRFNGLTWINAKGGTNSDHRGKLSFRATITKAWEDYETGWRFWAVLEEDVTAVDDFFGPAKLKKGTLVFVGQFDMETVRA